MTVGKFQQTPDAIKQSIAIIEHIKASCYDKDPEKRLKNYMGALHKVEYDSKTVDAFYESKQNGNHDFRYEDYFNVARLFLQKTGACQQFAVALAMLCYNDPEIMCYQTIVHVSPDTDDAKEHSRISSYKHSVNYVEIPTKRINGLVDVTNAHLFEDKIQTFQEYRDIWSQDQHKAKFTGMAHYLPGMKLEDIFIFMQGFGEGIKFDFESLEAGEKTFLECFNQRRLATVNGYQRGKETSSGIDGAL